EFCILIMCSFGNPKSSIAVIIIAILLFAEMNAIASLKLQSFNNNRARRNPLTADTKCCPDIARRRTKRFIRFQFWIGNGVHLYTTIGAFTAAGIAGAIGAGLGLGAALIATGIGNVWKEKIGTSSSQTVQGGSAVVTLLYCRRVVAHITVILLAFGVPNLFSSVGTLAAVGGLIGIDIDLGVDVGSAGDGKTTYPSHHFINHFDDGCS
ncbi:hypothetical protein DINM_000436, partial [Dirofilaria immitis]|nr:hypothetical protein [Dirofilaria immitis]